jgi:sterol desaturase/sphingolipid hydroxylase (fatty acid hydroxylase superfamily)
MWFSDPLRILALVVGGAVFWSLESLLPFFRYERPRWRRALPNLALTALLVLTNLALSSVLAGSSRFSTDHQFGLFFLFDIPLWLRGVLGVIALDLFTYLAHVLMHKSSIVWRFHRVHHSDKEVNVTTAFRQHPGETVWRVGWYALAIFVFGIPMWVMVTYLAVSALGAQLEHTNIRIPEFLDRTLRLLLVTPNMHKVHHSREQVQTDTNYANILSVWDRCFGTYAPTVDFQRLRYGLDGFDEQTNQRLVPLLILPFDKGHSATAPLQGIHRSSRPRKP